MQKQSPDTTYVQNLAVIAAMLELGAGAVQSVMGDDALSTQVHGQTQSTRDVQELLASRFAKTFGA